MLSKIATLKTEAQPADESLFNQFSDDEVVAQASQGDRRAFGELYDRYVKKIYNYIYFRTGNTFDAEDLTERVFFRAIRHIENYENRGLPFSAQNVRFIGGFVSLSFILHYDV